MSVIWDEVVDEVVCHEGEHVRCEERRESVLLICFCFFLL